MPDKGMSGRCTAADCPHVNQTVSTGRKDAEYLEISQGTVSDDTLRSTRITLISFDSLLVAENADRVTETAINHWIRELQQINAPKTVSDKVSYLRKFLRYLQYKWNSVYMPASPKTSDS